MYMTIPKEDVWMKKSFQIFKRDLGRLFRNRAAVLILVLNLVVLVLLGKTCGAMARGEICRPEH